MIRDSKQRLFEMMERVAGLPQLSLITEEQLSEVDWEGDFKDVNPASCWNVEELKEYLNKILANYSLAPHKRKKPDLIIHNKVIKKDEAGEIDVQEFIDNITAQPNEIITGGNAKMLKSATDDFYTVTIGLPAFKGLVYDIENKDFKVVSTCPGAGVCVKPCYARKGNFVRLPNIFIKQTRILNLLMNNPQKFKEDLKNEIIGLYRQGKDKEMRFRWNDSGDFFSKKYFKIGLEIMQELKNDNFIVKPYAHTKVADVYNQNRLPADFSNLSLADIRPDFVVSFSTDAKPSELGKVNLQGAKTSEIMFSDFEDLFKRDERGRNFAVDANDKLIFKSPNGEELLKQRVSKKFGVPNDETLLMHDEMMKKPEADKPTYNVIVQSKGETDISTQRPDVLRTFFLVH